ncbi:hypothetical protein [Hyalangium sp.]|uniref:hypothetical protein n=1 Tax=Hyalangium sp. TaxID=2028555 RepID=UPI002D304C3D|nr:hypothetical protein [Hyalangium sp.]HYH98533.1 hypothetical protein [Hyalangium sp.]
MFKPEDIPPELPEEVRALLIALKPEPPALIERRQRLLVDLTTQVASTTGALQHLLSALREVFLAMQPEVPFKASLSEDFSRALQRYAQEPAALSSPHPLLTECINYLHERVESTGLGAMLESSRPSHTP